MPESERPRLTPGQTLVLARLALGESDKRIAVALGLAPRTVRSHLASIYRVLPPGDGRNKRAAAIVWFLRQGHVQHEGAR